MSKTINHSSRAHALLSASSAHRWLACPPSAVAQELYPPGKPSEHALEGTLAHEVAEGIAGAVLNGEPREVWFDDPDKGITHEMIEHAEAYAEFIQEQMKSPNDLVLLEQRVDFSPWVPDGFGTADCIIIHADSMTVIDFKYGKGVEVSARDNPQMRLYALGALNDYGFAYDVDQVDMCIYQPRLNNIDFDVMTVGDLLAWGEEVKGIAALAAKGEGEYAAGMHCRWCAHAGKCPKLTEVCSSYVQHHDMKIKVPTLPPFEVANVLEAEPLITMWLKRVKETALSDMLKGEQIPGYKVVEGKAGNRKWVNEPNVAGILTKAGYSLEDVTETKLLSPAALGKVIGRRDMETLLGDMIDRAPGSPTIAPETDKRPVYNPDNNFKNLEE